MSISCMVRQCTYGDTILNYVHLCATTLIVKTKYIHIIIIWLKRVKNIRGQIRNKSSIHSIDQELQKNSPRQIHVSIKEEELN